MKLNVKHTRLNIRLIRWAGGSHLGSAVIDITNAVMTYGVAKGIAKGISKFGVKNTGKIKIKVKLKMKGGGKANPFKGKTAGEIDTMLRKKGYEPRGKDTKNGIGGYVNPKTGRSYHIDMKNSYNEVPHVDVNRLRSYKGKLNKKKYVID